MLGTTGGRRLAAALGALALALLGAGPAHAAFDCGGTMKTCQVQVDDSGRVWFWSPELLTEDALGDGTLHHGVLQTFVREGDRTTLFKGPDGNPIPYGERHRVSEYVKAVSPDGDRVYFETEASLTPDDHDVPFAGDFTWDGYELAGGRFTLITTGPLDECVPGDLGCGGASIVWASDDGRHVYFSTSNRMTAEDLDGSRDIYESSEGHTVLASTGPDEVLPDKNYSERAPDAEFLGASPDGTTIYFATYQQLTADDTEKTTSDIYSWHEGVTKRLTHTKRYQEGPGQPFESFWPLGFGGASEDGSIFYLANSPQAEDDTDGNADLYRTRPDGTSERLVDAGPTPTTGMYRAPLQPGAISQDGKRLYLTTTRSLLPEDTDAEADIYLLLTESGRLRLVSEGGAEEPPEDAELTFSGTSRDGRRAFFSTWERLTPEDTDDEVDVYEWVDGHDRLATPAAEGKQVGSFFQSISPNGRYVVFSTFEELVPGDGDYKSDLYLVDMGPQPQPEGAASASLARPARRHRHRRRIRLVSAESIPPRMGIASQGTFGDGVAHLRLACPKSETSGPCHGRARLFAANGRRLLAGGTFRIKAGRHARVALDGAGLTRRGGTLKAIARVRGADLLRNAARVHAKVALRHIR